MTLTTMLRKTPRLTTAGVFCFLVPMLAGLTGCATYDSYQRPSPDAQYPPSFYIQDVPFFPQEDFQCGPSVLASVLRFLGYDIKPEDISKEIYLKDIKGTLNVDMVSFARKKAGEGGLSVSEIQGGLNLIRDDVSRGYPVIVFVDLGVWNIRKGHYMLIAGYDDMRGGVIVYSGAEKDKFIPYKDFMRMWERGGYWALRIIPQ